MELLTVADVAKMMRLSISKVYKLAESGDLKSLKIDKSLRFTEEQLQDFIALKSVKVKK